ncbi:MAG: hypothetical protein KGJ64_10050 [Betaproteobacteria bacterium]|nr:hypothetical protein [Betaproteobacteria bacterium]
MPEHRPLLTRRRLLLGGMTAAGAVALARGLRFSPAGLLPFTSTTAAMADPIATIALGDPKATHLGNPGAGTRHHPVGMDFHERKWPFDQLGTVRYSQGPHSFEVSRVPSVRGSFDRDQPERGIYAWSISAFPMAGDTIPHALARDELFRLFERLHQAGWRRYIDVGDPRLSGRQTMRYFVEKQGNYSPDPAYVPTLDEWMRLNEDLPYWQFWADGTYMQIRVIDEPALRNPKRPGVYLFAITIESESAYGYAYFKEVEDMLRWKELLPAELRRLHKLRVAEEAEVVQRGYTIDTSYQDPPILALRTGA